MTTALTPEQIKQRLRYMGQQYRAVAFARGGEPDKHYLEQAADCIEALEAELAALREQTALAFAKFLHTLPDENGWAVGPSRVKFNKYGQLEEGPLWATQDDTDRWARSFLQKTDAALAAQEKA